MRGRKKVLTDEERKQRKLARSADWAQRNPDKVAAKKRRSRQRKNEQRVVNPSELVTQSQIRYHRSRNGLLDLLGRGCIGCEHLDDRVMEFDHILNDAGVDRERWGQDRSTMYKWYTDHPDDARARLQVLCRNCNWRKRLGLPLPNDPPGTQPSPIPVYRPRQGNSDEGTWRAQHRDYHADWQARWYKETRAALIDLLGTCCVACGEADRNVLEIDHALDDGKADRERFKGDSGRLYKYYLEHPDEARARLQLLCRNCNWLKRKGML